MKKKGWNNQGFSLVELLAAIVILGLLSAFAVVSISAILDKAESNHYSTQEKNLVMATKSYVQDNRNVLPKDIGDSKTITLQELQNRKYIGEVVDRSKMACYKDESYVTIFKHSKDGYSYRPYLKCRKYNTSEESYDENGPTISLSLNRNYANPSFTYSITTTGDSKIISYSYLIYKSGVLVRDSGSVPVSKEGSIDATEVSLKELVPGDFKIVFKATNIYGFTSTESVQGTIVAENAPICGTVSPDYTEDDWRQYDPNVPIEVTVKCEDANGSGCAKEIFSQLFTYDTGANYIEIVDNAGIKNNCEVGVFIDNTPPSKPILKNDYENTWINKSYTITATSKDDTAGIAYFQYRYPNSAIPEEREWNTYANSNSLPGEEKTFVTTEFSNERSEYVEIRACDYAGNCSETSQSMIKIDKTPPTITISHDGTLGSEGFYVTPVNVTIDPRDEEGGSGVYKYGVSTSTTPDYNMALTKVQATVINGIVWYGYVQDLAGNTAQTNTEKFVVICDPPKITFSLSGSTSTAVCYDGLTGKEIGRWSKGIGNSTHTVTCTDQYGLSSTCSQSYSSHESCSSCYSCACTGCCGSCKSGYCYCCCGNCKTCCSTSYSKSGGTTCTDNISSFGK